MATSSKMKSHRPSVAPPTAAASAILDAAERFAQTRGYNGFSYADIAAELGVTKASLHYHFPSKAGLGTALVERYRDVFGAALEAIDQQTNEPEAKLKQYVGLYSSVVNNQRMCLCGMLAAEYATLPAGMQHALILFFDANERWLTIVLKDGLRVGSFVFKEPASERARLLLGALEGAMLVARSYGNPRRFELAAACLLADLHAGRRSEGHKTSGTAGVRRPRRLRSVEL
jgi:TetR/AcrR family transcriptional repressor of nem operon